MNSINEKMNSLILLVRRRVEEPNSHTITDLAIAMDDLTLDEALAGLPIAKKVDGVVGQKLAEHVAYIATERLTTAINKGLDPVFPTGVALSVLKEALGTGRDGYPTLQVAWSPEDRRILNQVSKTLRDDANYNYRNFSFLTPKEVEASHSVIYARQLLSEWYGCFR